LKGISAEMKEELKKIVNEAVAPLTQSLAIYQLRYMETGRSKQRRS
jgi:hypothetical protein